MAYNFIAESGSEPSWDELAASIAESGVEGFPILPASKGEPYALGICVPMSRANADTWPGLEKLLASLIGAGFTLTELYTGETVTEATLPQVRARLIG